MYSHPNPPIHDNLAKALKKGPLNAESIQKAANKGSLPTVERDSSAYVNWNTTLSLLGPAPAQVWFSGVSEPVAGESVTEKPMDKLRDDLSVGVYYWWVDYNLPQTGYFWVEVLPSTDDTVLLIEVYDGTELVALYKGTATMNVQIQGGIFAFGGKGLWGRVDGPPVNLK